MESQDRATGAVNCSGSLSLDLPPGVAVVGGRRTLTSDVDYTVQPAADGSGPVVLLAQCRCSRNAARDPGACQPAGPGTATAAGRSATGRAAAPAEAVGAAPPEEPQRPLRRRPAKLRLRQCANERRDRGLLRWRARSARPQHGRAIRPSDRLSASPEQRELLRQTRDRFLGYRDRCPNRSVHRRRLCRPHARDPRHHGRPLAARDSCG